MATMMDFPKTVDEFIKQYSFKDKKEIYTNGSNLIPVFRVEQMLNHYFHFACFPDFLEKEQNQTPITDGFIERR